MAVCVLVHSCACKPCHIQTFEAVIYRASVRIKIILRCFPETHSLTAKPATVAGRTFLQGQAGFYLLHFQKKKGHQQEFGPQRLRALEPSTFSRFWAVFRIIPVFLTSSFYELTCFQRVSGSSRCSFKASDAVSEVVSSSTVSETSRVCVFLQVLCCQTELWRRRCDRWFLKAAWKSWTRLQERCCGDLCFRWSLLWRRPWSSVWLQAEAFGVWMLQRCIPAASQLSLVVHLGEFSIGGNSKAVFLMLWSLWAS